MFSTDGLKKGRNTLDILFVPSFKIYQHILDVDIDDMRGFTTIEV